MQRAAFGLRRPARPTRENRHEVERSGRSRGGGSFEIGFTGLLKGDRVRRREHGQRLEPLWVGCCKRPRNHAAPIMSDDMARLRTNSVGDSKGIFHETLWTIFSHVERSGSTGIATLVESDGPVS